MQVHGKEEAIKAHLLPEIQHSLHPIKETKFFYDIIRFLQTGTISF
jgi:hypothetical protein